MSNENILKTLANKYVFFPFLGMCFIFGLFLLFYRDLDSSLRTILVPGITVYMIGTLLIGYLYFELDVINVVRSNNRGEKADPQPSSVIWTFRILHVIWFLFLIIYLFRNNALQISNSTT
jgi:hypothetical protein